MYGRVPLLSSSFFIYTLVLSLSLLITAFFYPTCSLLFALMCSSYASFPCRIVSSSAFGLVFSSALTLLLNYASLKPSPKHHQLLFITWHVPFSLFTHSMIMMTSLFSLLVRVVMHSLPFLFGFRLLSLLSLLLLLGIVFPTSIFTRSHDFSSPPGITSSTSHCRAIPSKTTPKPLMFCPANTISPF